MERLTGILLMTALWLAVVTFLLLLASGCGGEFGTYPKNFCLRTTCVGVAEGADKPYDLPEWLEGTWQALFADHGQEKADDIMAFKLHLWPDGVPLYWNGQALPGVGGYYLQGSAEIYIRVRANDTDGTSLPHEVFQHRVPDMIDGDPNALHNPNYALYERWMRDRVNAWLETESHGAVIDLRSN